MASRTFAGKRQAVEPQGGEAIEAVAVEAAPAKGQAKKRAHKPAGTPAGGEFVADDPATPEVDEAYQA